MSFQDLSGLRRYYAGQAGELLDRFYLPVLGNAVSYDRQSGYFDTYSLVQAATGLAAFVVNRSDSSTVGTPSSRAPRAPMRLVTGATWSWDDIEAFGVGFDALRECLNTTLPRALEPDAEECARLGLPPGWRPEQSLIARTRLGTLAWMVAQGLLQVKIAFPLDADGRPMLPGAGGALFHPKVGVLTDARGAQLGFVGSVNETGRAWTRNRESFSVSCSWVECQREEIDRYSADFERVWAGRDTGLLVCDLPAAVADYLSAFSPPEGEELPRRHPQGASVETLNLRVAAQAWLDAPLGPEGPRLVLDPLWSGDTRLKLFPHQARVVRRAAAEYPHSFLFCDEVGLGKTIEAGIALRTLILARRVKRVLIVAPRALVRQWMEEMREKFALTAWFYDGKTLTDVGGRVRAERTPLDREDVVIVSRHLIARQDRRDEVLGAQRWDLIIVDEAHAARASADGAPNQLLALLQELRTRDQMKCLWLLTATPMQINPREVFDLLRLCGMAGAAWGDWDSLSGFRNFFEDLSAFASDPGVRERVVEKTRRAVALGADELKEAEVPEDWTSLRWRGFIQALQGKRGVGLQLRGLTRPIAEKLTPHLSRQTPLAVYMFRHTRATLRAYQQQGLFVGGLADRVPEDLPVLLASSEEAELYVRIDAMCREFYRFADRDEQAGVGFLMAVFRKRLSSSFRAFQRSLERRRDLIDRYETALTKIDAERATTGALLQALPELRTFFGDEDGDEDDDGGTERFLEAELVRLQRMSVDPMRRADLGREREYLGRYIADLGAVQRDSKFGVFRTALLQALDRGHRVIVFTQYSDTMDFIREQLAARYCDRMACYSGRGGEIWDPAKSRWINVDKKQVVARTSSGHSNRVDILLGTDAASEGLNLQEFSALFNYDLPWNPMRVEQRIGRIDRIGQRAERVQISNLYVKDTIEEDTYGVLKTRIRDFENVVGPLQPILAEMPVIFRKWARGEMELQEAKRELTAAAARPAELMTSLDLCVKDDLRASDPTEGAAPGTMQEQMAAWCVANPAPGMRIVPVSGPKGERPIEQGRKACLSMRWPSAPPHLAISRTDDVLVTFDGQLADRNPPTVESRRDDGSIVPASEGIRLLTWGDPLLLAWLEAVRGHELTDAAPP